MRRPRTARQSGADPFRARQSVRESCCAYCRLFRYFTMLFTTLAQNDLTERLRLSYSEFKHTRRAWETTRTDSTQRSYVANAVVN